MFCTEVESVVGTGCRAQAASQVQDGAAGAHVGIGVPGESLLSQRKRVTRMSLTPS